MKKKSYMAPDIKVQHINLECALLTDSPETHNVEWTPKTSAGSIPTQVTEEGNGNLGDADSEITGAKGNSFWSDWD